MIDKNALLDYLAEIDALLSRKIMLIAVGGTAMTLLNLKATTRDVDFCLEGEDYELFEKAISRKKTFKVDLFKNGYIFIQQLPTDYAEIATKFAERKFEKIDLRTLHPLDIILTKIGRLNARDEADIEALMKTKRIEKSQLIKRFKEISKTYGGADRDYAYHFNLILRRYY